ncbi:MAG: GNAT family N-acetyltransferase [Sandaracinus sp.]|nr:GNAT family N-acetyltransferase [Sandaracinus sp.]
MPRVQLSLSVDIERTPRVVQLEGIFDVPEAKRRTVDFDFDVPIEERDWQIGLIVGPSGAGKSVCARHLFGDAIVHGYDWHPKRSVVDCFDVPSVNDATAALSSVGFSSPPSWMKPFHVLSNGERFRATLARALVDPRPLVVIDEFTSVVDRQVAKVGSFAVSKAVRKSDKRFVAVSCHDDIAEWLQPDWVLQPHVGAFEWRSQRRRPDVAVEVVRVDRAAWRWFAPHHYLSADLHRAARCFVGLIDGAPAAFAAVLPFPHAKRTNFSSLSRVVVLPDYQGLGLGAYAFTEAIARITAANGRVLFTHPSHPALVRVWARSKLWAMNSAPGFAGKLGASGFEHLSKTQATRRRVAHFRWCGGAWPEPERNEASRRLWA